MGDDESGGFRIGKKTSDKGGEVDFKTKAGTAWSHSFLNQKPWHPLSYPNQRRKWIAEQTSAQKERRAEEVAREYAQEQEFMRQTALINKKEKEKLELMRAVSFMYVKPPGYNPESAKAAEMSSERKMTDDVKNSQERSTDGASSSKKMESVPSAVDKKKQRPKDVFGRALPTEEQFEVLKNAPRLETGVAGRAKPFGVEIRNVKCLRCGNFGHQSGDRECPLKDLITPNEESRLKRDDPLTAILAQTDSVEPLKWELKQKSPPHGGFDADDPNQQIVAGDVFDEYGGFLGEVTIPELLTKITSTKTKKKSKKSKPRRKSPPASTGKHNEEASESSSDYERRRKSKRHSKKKGKPSAEPISSDSSDGSRHLSIRRNRHRRDHSSSSEDSDYDEGRPTKHGHSCRYRDSSDITRKYNDEGSESSSGDERRRKSKGHRKKKRRPCAESSSFESPDDRRHLRIRNRHRSDYSSSSENSDYDQERQTKHGYSRRYRHSDHHPGRHRS